MASVERTTDPLNPHPSFDRSRRLKARFYRDFDARNQIYVPIPTQSLKQVLGIKPGV